MVVLAPRPISKPLERRRHQRVRVEIHGRFMLEDRTEHPCVTVDVSPGGARFACARVGRVGERIVAYLETLGRIEGSIARLLPGGFAMTIAATLRKRDRLASQLTWLANRHVLNLPEDRRHDRVVPRKATTTLRLASGRTAVVRIVDISLSGCAVASDIPVDMGASVMIGTRQGRILRLFENGIAIEFAHPLSEAEFGPDIEL